MTDKKENNKSKLTLGSSKLSLNKEINSDLLRKNYLSANATKGKGLVLNSNKSLSLKKSGAGDSNISSDELNKKLSVLQKATLDFEKEKQQAELKAKQHEEEQKKQQLALEKKAAEEKLQSKSAIVAEPKKDAKDEAAKIEPAKPAPTSEKPKFKADKATDNKSSEEQKKQDPKNVKFKKGEEPKRGKHKINVNSVGEDALADDVPLRTRSLASIKRAREKEKRKLESQPAEKVYREVILPEIITVAELANRMSEQVKAVIKELMKLGVMATANQSIDADTAELVIETLGHTSKRVQDSDVESSLEIIEDKAEDLKPRAPIVTVMGHVDHGKTSLLDALKESDIAAGEAGGITQHIGAYRVKVNDTDHVTFVDTPGHEAFTEMRSRGAKVTDIVVLVVAADDGIMAQTIEAINHAKAAEVPIIVAINKMDKPEANPERVKSELLSHELIPEDLGGDVITVEVSAKQRLNLDKLLENILLVAEMLELKANPNAEASGVVIESKMDKNRGSLATILVQRGTLNIGDMVLAGTAYGKVKKMQDAKGQDLLEASPSMPVEILGLNNVPLAGDLFNVTKSEKQARDISEYRERKLKEKNTIANKTSLDDLFKKAGQSDTKELSIIVKADVQGSIEAIKASLEKISNEEINVKVLHGAVGGINESDISLAAASNAIIVGFNVRIIKSAEQAAEKAKIDVRYYSIIYNLIDDIKAAASGMLSPTLREQYLGNAEIREVFNITKAGKIAGCYVTKGMIKRGAKVRLLRDSVIIHDGSLKTLRRFKDDVKEVKENFECGIAFENYDDIKVNDTLEVYEIIEEKKSL